MTKKILTKNMYMAVNQNPLLKTNIWSSAVKIFIFLHLLYEDMGWV